MKQLNYEDITPRGELARRLGKNFSRLEDKIYLPDSVYTSSGGWPGDYEGRVMLALILHERISRRESAYLREILRQFSSRVNSRGYFDYILPDGEFSEQQLSGHNWTLRALNEYKLSGRDEFVSGAAERIVENLYLPARGHYSRYCLDPALRPLDGQASGHAADRAVDGWYLSTDIGCAYMSFDSLTQYYELTGDKRVGELIDEMFDTFTKIDFVGARMQTHASLTATRGILRYYGTTKRPELLEFAKRLFKLYTDCAMTQNYCNYNWFARPSWTEPCAIVDSYMVACELYRLTGEQRYLWLATNILHNGLGHAERSNGGFGCDSCLRPDEPFLSCQDGLYEAFWCCTMRGAEGLTSAARNAVFDCSELGYGNLDCSKLDRGNLDCGKLDRGNGFMVCEPSSGDYTRDDGSKLEISGDFVHTGRAMFELTAPERVENLLRVYIPDVYETPVFRLNGNRVDTEVDGRVYSLRVSGSAAVELTAAPKLCELPLEGEARGRGYTLRHGVLILGCDSDESKKAHAADLSAEGMGVYRQGDAVWKPIDDTIEKERTSVTEKRTSVICPLD